MILDTNIVIEIFKGNNEILNQLVGEKVLNISSVTAMELYYGGLNKIESQKIKKALTAFELIEINPAISAKAIELIEIYSKSHGLMIPDALIAATAIVREEKLKTLNIKDFRFIKALLII